MGDNDADVVIVGAGIAGAMLAWRLARDGVTSLIVEAGPRITRAEAFDQFTRSPRQDDLAPYPTPEWAPGPNPAEPDAYIIREGLMGYLPHYIRGVGGTTWHWSAACDRLWPSDMELRSRFGVGTDWPLSYADLEPFYDEAERELGVAGEDFSDPDLPDVPQRGPFPLPRMASGYVDKVVTAKLASHGIRMWPMAVARNSVPYDGRPVCRGNNLCIPLCPIGAQYAAIVHVEKAERLGCRILDRTLVTRVDPGTGNRAAVVHTRGQDGTTGRIAGRIVVIAANGVETPRLALMSASETHPDGVANSSGLVGRYFMDHVGMSTPMKMPEPVWAGRGPVFHSAIVQFAEGAYRSERGSLAMGLDNKLQIAPIANRLLEQGKSGPALDDAIREHAAARIEFNGFVEPLPDPDNRVQVDWERRDSTGLPRIRLRFEPGEYVWASMEVMRGHLKRIAGYLGAEMLPASGTYYGANHLIGTMRMGGDPRHAVVSRDGRCHDHPSLFVAGSSVFPTAGGAKGPTLTIAALSLRMAHAIREQLRKGN